MNKSVFRVGVTRDFLGPDGTCDLDDIAGPNKSFLTEQVCTGPSRSALGIYCREYTGITSGTSAGL